MRPIPNLQHPSVGNELAAPEFRALTNSAAGDIEVAPKLLLVQLIAIVPRFEAYWRLDDNLAVDDDGSYSLHGVCAELSGFFRESHFDLSRSQIKHLFGFVEDQLVDDSSEENDLDNALCTCFLENISSEACGEAARPFMGPKSRRYFDNWHHYPLP